MIGRFLATMNSFAIKIGKYAAFHFEVQAAFFLFFAKNHFNRLKEIKHAKRLKRLDILSDSSSILKDEEDKARALLAKYRRIA